MAPEEPMESRTGYLSGCQCRSNFIETKKNRRVNVTLHIIIEPCTEIGTNAKCTKHFRHGLYSDLKVSYFIGHGSSSSKMSHTELRNVGSSRTSQLVCVLLLFCATYHLQLVGLDDQVRFIHFTE